MHDTVESSSSHPTQSHYIRIWAILVVLLILSVLGPMVGIKIVTLIAAFGIALVKAYLVAKHFMHIDVEQPIVRYFLALALAFMVLFFAGTAPDVMEHEGQQWVNEAAAEQVERALAAQDEHDDQHPEESHE